jgi:hypothetical protein
VIAGLKDVQARIDEATTQLRSGAQTLRDRFPRESSVYPLIETLGAATDLTVLRDMADSGSDVGQRIDVLHQAVAALEANTISAQIASIAHLVRVLAEAKAAATTLTASMPPSTTSCCGNAPNCAVTTGISVTNSSGPQACPRPRGNVAGFHRGR